MSLPLSAVQLEAPLVPVSRQPVLDAHDRLVGYRISYSMPEAGSRPAPTPAAMAEIVGDLLAVIDPAEHVSGHMAHLPLTREMLLRQELPPLDPAQVLLRIHHEDAVCDELAPAIEAAAGRYRLELDGLPGRAVDLDLLERFRVVEIDLNRWSLEDAAAVLPHLRYRGTLALGANVSTHEQRDQARSLGFEWFSGPFFCTPNTLGGTPVQVGDLKTVVELCRLQQTDVSLEELVAVIEQDLGLGVRLLRYMNSAYFGLSGRVSSITQAAMMLGTRGLSRWALIASALGDSSPISRELSLTGLTRARACELIGLEREPPLNGDELFTTGLLSTAPAVFRMPMERVVDELPLADAVTNALLCGDGPSGEILRSVIAYEQGEFLARSVRSMLLENSAAYRAGLQWARQAVFGVA